MSIQRLDSNKIWTDQPIEFVREAVWHGLNRSKVSNVVIDSDRDLISGFRGNNITSHGFLITAKLANQEGGTWIQVNSKPTSWGYFDFGAYKRRSRHLTDAVEIALRDEARPVVGPVESVPLPIADPFADHSKVNNTPRYGPALPFPMGISLLLQAAFSLVCCQILSPFVWLGVNKAFKTYGDADPGDKGLLRAARVLGIIGTCLLLLAVLVNVVVAQFGY